MKVIFLFMILMTYQKSPIIESYEFDSEIFQTEKCGNNIHYILTQQRKLYRYNISLKIYQNISNLLINKATEILSNEEEKNIQIGNISKLIYNKSTELIIIMGSLNISWYIENCNNENEIYTFIQYENTLDFLPHIENENWILKIVGSRFLEDKFLYVSLDKFKSWKLIGSYIIQVNWGYIVCEKNNNVPKERILMTYFPRGKDNNSKLIWNNKIDFVLSDDFFQSTSTLIRKGNKFLLTERNLFVAQVIDQESQEVRLLMSESKNFNYNFSQINLIRNIDSYYTNELKDISFSILEINDNIIFMSIIYNGLNLFSDIYVSDSIGLKFTLSFPYNIYNTNRISDFGKIEGIEGVYITNGVSEDFINEFYDLKDLKDNYSILSKKIQEKNSNNDTYKHIKTFITFNNGGTWNRIPMPKLNFKGENNTCQNNDCFLNLYGHTIIYNNIQSFYSPKNTLGIIISNGSIGEFLDLSLPNIENNNEINVYLSNNGGKTFQEIRQGAHIYEIGKNGSVIIMARANIKTNKIIISFNNGITFDEVKIIDDERKGIILTSIKEDLNSNKIFYINGYIKVKKYYRSMIYKLDLEFFNITDCTSNDYEKWNLNNKECILGSIKEFTKKKESSKCFANEKLSILTQEKICECNDNDYECDYGYEKRLHNKKSKYGNCERIKYNKYEADEELKYILDNCVGYYSLSLGYKKIPGSKCKGGKNYDKILIPCTNKIIFSSFGKKIFFILCIILSILIFFSFYYDFIDPFNKFSQFEQKEYEEEQQLLI